VKGNPNVKHYVCLLDAEAAALRKDEKSAKSNYLQAIAFAARTGHLQDAALCNERYAEYLQGQSKERNEEEVKYRLLEAIRFYEFWGANAKVQKLRLDYGFSPVAEVSSLTIL
jgi:hypothetical protein